MIHIVLFEPEIPKIRAILLEQPWQLIQFTFD